MFLTNEASSTAANDEDDPVEHEFNVYQAKHLTNRLNVLNHATRPRDKPYRVNNATAKIKAELPKVEFTIPIDEYRHFFKDQESKLKLSSKKRNVEVRRLTALTFCEGEVHLNPLSAILDLTPDMSDYFRKQQQQPNEKLTEQGSSSATTEERLTLITPRVMTKRTEDENKKLKESYEYLRGEEAKIPWVDVKYRTCDEGDLNTMVCDRSITGISDEFHMTEMDYFDRLVPTYGEPGGGASNKKNSNKPVTAISATFPIRTLTAAQVQRLQPVPSNNTASISMSSVQPPISTSNLPVQTTTTKPSVNSAEVSQSDVKTAAQAPLRMLQIDEQQNRLMTSSVPPTLPVQQASTDQKHVQQTSSPQNPVQFTSSPVKNVQPTSSSQTSFQSLSSPKKTAKISSQTQSVSPKLDSNDSYSLKVIPSNDEGLITAVVASREEPHANITNGRTDPDPVTNSDNYNAIAAMTVDSIVPAMAVDDNTPTTTGNDSGNNNDLVEFAKEKLKTRVVMTLEDFVKQFNIHMDGVTQGASRQQLEEALVRAGGVNLSTSRHHQVYVLRARGDKFDAIRDCLVETLLSKSTLKMSYLRSVLEKKGLNNISENDLRKVLKEYCNTKGGSWVSKGFVESESSSKPRKRTK